MSIHRSAMVMCDGVDCDWWTDADGGTFAFASGSVAEVRQRAKEDGWKRFSGDRHLCPECIDAGNRLAAPEQGEANG